MKKISILVMIFVLGLGLFGCAGENPSGMKQEDFEIGLEILDTVDAYLDGTITSNKASSKIGNLYEKINDSDHHGTRMVYNTAQSIEIDLDNSSSKSKVEADRDKLADYLGK